MSDFVVSARKYRPATFQSVVGQQHITSTLRNAIERGQLAHAYLFCGPRGVGKTTCARIFAKAVNCLRPDGAEACNECESCRSFNEGRSLNIHELDAASNNSVEDIRTLIEQVRIVPQVGRYAVFIIDEVHMLSAAAFNAFLKTLEEPPAHAVFILATTEKHKIIPTILSRCQIYDFNRIRVEDAVGYLRHIATQEAVTSDDESLNLIAQKADGGMRDALSMFDKAVSFCGPALNYHDVAQTLNVLDYDTYFGITDMLLGGDYVRALLGFDAVLTRGFSGQTFLAGLDRHLRDLLVARNPDTLPLLEVAGSLAERYRAQAVRCTPDFLFGAMALLTEADGKLRQSSNQRLLIELSLMKLAGMGQKKNDPVTTASLPELNQGAGYVSPGASAPATERGDVRQNTPQPGGAPTVAPAANTGRSDIADTSADPAGNPATAPDNRTPASSSAAEQHPDRAGEVEATMPQSDSRDVVQEPAGELRNAEHPATSQTVKPGRISLSLSELQAPLVAEPRGATTAPSVTNDPASETNDRGATAAGLARAAEDEPKETPGNAAAAAQPASGQSASSATDGSNSKARPAPQRPLVSGASISELMQTSVCESDPEPDAETGDETPETDPESDRKLENYRQQILALIQQKRPRFVAAFEQMTFRDGVIAVSVPSASLRDEILRSKTGMLTRIAEMAGIHGALDLEVTVNEEIRASRPIKLEDRVKHLTEKNPLLTELRKALDLEVE